LENGICSCGLPARCCQPTVVGGVIYADLWGELSTHLAPQALFAQSSPVREPLLQAFPFPSTLGKVTLHLRSQACVFIYSSCGRWVFPLSCVFLPLPLSQAFLLLITGRCCCSCSHHVCLQFMWEVGLPSSHKLSCSWLLGVHPLLPEPLQPTQLVYLLFWEGFPSPTLQSSGCPTLFSTCL
jgi:hypothetical protein